MKRLASLALLLVLVLSLTGATGAGAATGITWTSGFQVQNLDPTVPASVTLSFYDAQGVVTQATGFTINPLASQTFFPITQVAPGFLGSLVIESTTNIRAINNLVGSGPASLLSATNGFQTGSTNVSLPLVMCNNGGFNTFFTVQNAGTVAATINVKYTPGSSGLPNLTDGPISIPIGASKTFDQTAGATSGRNCSTLADASGKFVGSATITSDQPIVATVEQLNTTNFQSLMGYGAFPSGSPTVALPLVMANNGGFYSGIQVQNAGTAPTTVTITYSGNTAGGLNPGTVESFPLNPGASKTIIQNGTAAQSGGAVNWTALGRYVGAATVTSSPAQPLVAIVNQVSPSPAKGAAYEGFDPAVATPNVSAPLIMANNGGYYTGFQVQNVGTVPTTVTVKYSGNTAGTFPPANESFPLNPGASKTIIQNGTAAQSGGANDWTGQKYVGSATITSSGAPIVAIVNQVSNTVPGDQFAATDAFNF